jgi:putative ABC transport system ATP-binding protein
MLSLRDVSKRYFTATHEIDALGPLTMDIAEQEFVAIMGRSGSGKSTLLNILALVDEATGGSFRFLGHEMVGCPERERVEFRRLQCSYVFQDTRLIDELSVRANVEVGILYRDIPAQIRKICVEEAMDLAGIAHRAAHPVHVLSAGQQRRVEVARAIVGKPSIIFADEPVGDLDFLFADQLIGMLWTLNRRGTTVVMVTHSAAYAANAHQIIYLADGLRIDGYRPHTPPLRLVG